MPQHELRWCILAIVSVLSIASFALPIPSGPWHYDLSDGSLGRSGRSAAFARPGHLVIGKSRTGGLAPVEPRSTPRKQRRSWATRQFKPSGSGRVLESDDKGVTAGPLRGRGASLPRTLAHGQRICEATVPDQQGPHTEQGGRRAAGSRKTKLQQGSPDGRVCQGGTGSIGPRTTKACAKLQQPLAASQEDNQRCKGTHEAALIAAGRAASTDSRGSHQQ